MRAIAFCSCSAAPRARRIRTALSTAVCTSLLLGHTLIPAPVAAADTYYALRGQLDTLVNQRQAQLQALSSADGAVGALLARDFLVALRPALASAATVIGSTYQQAARYAPASAPQTYDDRSVAPGTLLGAHRDRPTAQAAAPAYAAGGAWRAAVLRSSELSLSRATAVAAAVSGVASPASSLTLSAASFDDAAVSNDGPATSEPPQYQRLGDAQDLWPVRAVASAQTALPLRALDPRIWRASPPTPADVTPPVLTEREGMAALAAYGRIAATLSLTIGGIAPPAALVSAVDPAQRPTDVAGLSARTGQFTLSAAAAPAYTAATLGASFVAPQVTWTFSATTHLATGTATLAGAGSSAGIALQSLHLATVPGGKASASAVQGAQMSISVTRQGGARFALTTGLSDGTAVQVQAVLDTIAADPDVQAALARERLALLQLQSIVPAGNAVFARLQPLYAARERAYQAALGAVMARNQQVESYWWARSTAHSNYLLARGRWLKHTAAYARYLAHLRQGSAPAGSPTAALGPSASRHPGLSMPLTDATATPAAPLFGGTPVNPAPFQTAAATATAPAPTSTEAPTDTPAPTSAPSPATPTDSATPLVAPDTATPTAPAPSDTPTAAAPTATATFAATATPSAIPPVPTATPRMSTATPSPPSATAAPSVSATPASATTSPSATRTPTAVPGSPTLAADSPTATLPATTPTATASATAAATATIPAAGDTPSATPTSTIEPTAGATASFTPVSTPNGPVAGPSPTPVTYVTTPPGPPPAYVPDPGLEPNLEPLPPPVLPLPGWLVAPPVFVAPTLRTGMPSSLNASGYANLTPDQLYADGAMDVPGGFMPPIQGVITTYWGGSTPWQSFHPGLDIAAPAGVPVHAAADGVVVYAGLAVPGNPTMSYGNCVLIQHAANVSTLYGHMQLGPLGLQVQAGEVVHQGQIIGYEGATGWATGPHVHFEMRLNNTQFDPLLLVSARTIQG